MTEAGNLLHCGAVVIGPARLAALNLGQIKRLHWHRRPDTGEALRKRSFKEKGNRRKMHAVRITAFMHFQLYVTSIRPTLKWKIKSSAAFSKNKTRKKKKKKACKPLQVKDHLGAVV